MRRRTWLLCILGTSLAACGGSGGGGGGGGGLTPVNLTNFQAASDIIGQSAVTGGTPNNGGGVTPNQAGLWFPAVHVAEGSLYVADSNNHRVMGFNAVPTGLGANADFVLGQAGFNTRVLGNNATGLTQPTSCWVASNTLFVADYGNNRILLFSPPPTTTAAAASVALGQPSLTAVGTGNGTSGLTQPADVCVAANRVVVADVGNHRVLVWNGIPAVSGAPAQVVVGQPNFTTFSAATSAVKLNNPDSVWTDGFRLAVADTLNHRVLIWTTFPTSNGQAADIVVGQPDFTTGTSGTGASKMSGPQSVCSDGVNLFVADSGNNRVLIFAPFPTGSNPAATGVLGQNSFTNVTSNDDDQNAASDATPSARTMDFPDGVTTIGNKLFVTDANNHRVLIFTGS